MPPYKIKPMETETEMDGKGYVHYKSWQETYPGLVPQAYLESVTLESCTAMARRWRNNILIAKDGKQVIGFAAFGPCRDDRLRNCGEIIALYTLQACYGKGAGQMLLQAALEKLSGYAHIFLWVLRGNSRAIRFYEKTASALTAPKEISFRHTGNGASNVSGKVAERKRLCA